MGAVIVPAGLFCMLQTHFRRESVYICAGIYILGLGNAFYKNNMFYGLIHIPGIEVIIAGIIAVVGVVVNRGNYKRVSKKGR